MSGPTPGGGVPPPQRPTANGVPPGGMVSQHSQASSAQSGTGSTGSASASNLNSIVRTTDLISVVIVMFCNDHRTFERSFAAIPAVVRLHTTGLLGHGQV